MHSIIPPRVAAAGIPAQRRVDFALYVVTDRQQTRGRPLVPLLQSVFEVGIPAVQIRERDLETNELVDLTKTVQRHAGQGTRVLINDRIDLAMALDLAGVHLRADSLPVAVARRLLGTGPLIGVSTHASEEVIDAEAAGADFVVLGPIYETPSKRPFGEPLGLAALEHAARRSRLPIFAIGGMTLERIREVHAAGAAGIAVLSAIMAAPAPEQTAAALLSACAIFAR